MAYWGVRDTWVRRGIWNDKWSILPGTSWKHEQPIKEMLREELDSDYYPLEVGTVEDRPILGAYLEEQAGFLLSDPPSKASKARRRNKTSTRRQPGGSKVAKVQQLFPVPDIASATRVDSTVQP
jgi:hypothetical protein